MKQVPDRTRLRRVYLWKQLRPMVAIISSLSFFAIMVKIEYNRFSAKPALLIFGIWMCLIQMLVQLVILIPRTIKKARELPYVPPVTAATLPADEILVRASGEPAAQSEVLLRAAQRGQETAQEELLRGSQGE